MHPQSAQQGPMKESHWTQIKEGFVIEESELAMEGFVSPWGDVMPHPGVGEKIFVEGEHQATQFYMRHNGRNVPLVVLNG